MKLRIAGMIETSFIDWDGKIVTTLYVPNCNFRCKFCYNYPLILHPEDFETIPKEKIFDFLVERKDFIDGVCITGGEPTLFEDLPDFLNEIKNLGFTVKLDTNGTAPEMIELLIEKKLVDYIAMDVKAPLNNKYNEIADTNVDLEKIRKSIEIIMKSCIDYEFRTTIVPTLLSRLDICEIAKFLKSAKKYVLQQFRPEMALNETLRKVNPYSKEKISEIANSIRAEGVNVMCRGETAPQYPAKSEVHE